MHLILVITKMYNSETMTARKADSVTFAELIYYINRSEFYSQERSTTGFQK